MTIREQIEQHYGKSTRMLLKVLERRVGTREGAEDVLHDAYERVLRYQNSYNKDLQTFTAWFNGILNNAARDYKAVERRLGMSVEFDEELDEGVKLLDWEQDTIDKVKIDVESKSFPLRQALYLYFFKQYKPKDIALVLEMSNTNIRKGVERFKKEMQAKYIVGG